MNHAAIAKYGYSAEEFKLMTLKDIRPHEDVQALVENVSLTSDLTLDSSTNWHHLKKSGELLDVEIYSHLIQYEGRKARHVLINDITEKKKAEQALIKSEEKYRTIFENVQDVFYQTDLQGIIHEISPSIKYFSEFSREELLNSQVADLYFDIEERKKLLEKIYKNSEIRDFKIQIKTKTGELKHASVNARLIFDAQGKPLHIDGALRDITKRVIAEEKLKQSEEKFRNLFVNHSAVKLIIDPDTGRIVEANQAASEFYGWSIVELTTMKIFNINTSAFDLLKSDIEKVRTVERVHFEFQHRCKDGTIKDVEVFSSKIVIGGKDYLHSIIHDVSKKKEIETRNRLLSKSIDQSPVSVVITNPKGVIEYVNPRFLKLTGYNYSDVIGRNPRLLKSGYHPDSFYTELWETISSGNEWSGEIRNKKKSGEMFWESASISPLINEKGEITHYVGIKEDISEKRKLLEDLIQAKEKAEASDKLKTAFINNISHEVRTPLNGIIGFSDLLTNPDLPPVNRLKFSEIIKKSSDRLLNTITSYMDISLIVSGNMDVRNQEFKISTFMEEVLETYRYECLKKGLILELKMPAEISEGILTIDKDILRKILQHLITNSLKFTTKGYIECGLLKLDKGLEFYVKDTGIGIELEKLQLIFNYFTQADISLTRGYEGSGLGLAIANGLVHLLGGTLSVESEVNIGSIFRFSLPNEMVGKVSQTVQEPVTTIVRTVKPLILVAEDDEINFKFIEIVLQRADYDILHAANGKEAVMICQDHHDISLVLMDMKMPVMGGFEATRLIKSFLPELRIVALTAYVTKEDEMEALSNGFDAFIPKPINRLRLLELIEKFLV